ncbi:dihydrolipoamide acetyltransferase family protein [Bacteroidota bacterium]
MLEIILPAMGEGIIEAEITRWLVSEGDRVAMDAPLVEVATDKVDTEIPSPGAGIIHKILLAEGDVPRIGQVLAILATDDESTSLSIDKLETEIQPEVDVQPEPPAGMQAETLPGVFFLSPVVRKMAMEQGLSPAEIENIPGTGLRGRITRADLEAYKQKRAGNKESPENSENSSLPSEKLKKQHEAPEGKPNKSSPALLSKEQIYGSGPSTVEEMDRMRKLIADHMVYSKQVAPHVTSFVESDVTEMIGWRNRVKDDFEAKYNQKMTITTLILEGVIKALKEHPRINVSVDGYKIIRKEDINLGMAVALTDGNLIVPVIHNADKLSLAGLAAEVNDLAERARSNKLLPADIQGGTFTVTNMGQFGNIAGTPIINQPQVAILAVGAIVKKPAVVETPEGDAIGIRHMLILSLAYDHRVVDGALGGAFLKSIGDNLQSFDSERVI